MPHIYVLGDSISMQYGPYLEMYLKPTFNYSRKTGIETITCSLDVPQGANGGDSSRVLAFLENIVKSGEWKYDLLLLNCGLHDIKIDLTTGEKQISPESYKDNLWKIVGLLRSSMIPMVWIRTTPCDDKIYNKEGFQFLRFNKDCIEYNAIADQIMNKAGIPKIDLYNFTLSLEDTLYADHVHFHKIVQKKQAAFISGWLHGMFEQAKLIIGYECKNSKWIY